MSDQSCVERVKENLFSRLEDLRILWDLYCCDPEANDENLGNMYEYGLSFDYVAPETFQDQEEGYFRYQLSWGGPSDEFRIYADKISGWRWSIYKIEYWLLDWFDGAKSYLNKKDEDLIKEIFQSFFVDSGCADEQYNQSIQEEQED